MIDYIIELYINKLTHNDIKEFSDLKGIPLTLEEARFILPYIKKYWRTLIYGNANKVFDILETKTDEQTLAKYKQLFSILNEMIKTYQRFIHK